MKTPSVHAKRIPQVPPGASLVVVILAALLALSWGMASIPVLAEATIEPPTTPVLARVDVDTNIETLGIPLYAHLVDAEERRYVLTLDTLPHLDALKRPYQVIDGDATGRRYLVARDRSQGSISRQAAETLPVLYDDGRRLILRDEPGLDERLSTLGFDLKRLSQTPMIFRPARREMVLEAITPLPAVRDMLRKVSAGGLRSHTARLGGISPATIGGLPYSITTRHTASGTPIQKAGQYVQEQLKTFGLRVAYQNWSLYGYSGRNVIGEIRGSRFPNEIVLVTAHLDDMPATGNAPGADDNASGCAAALLAADILKRYRFDRTLRFVFFTGEEQGLLGSEAYARSIADQDIVGVFNMDMIAYNTLESSPVLRLHLRPSGNPGHADDALLANRFVNVVQTYGLSSALTPINTADGEDASDHSSFWDRGFAAILAIEDDYDDFNPHYHTPKDTQGILDFPYFTAFAKASLGTAAHLAGNPRALSLRPDFIVSSINLVPVSPWHGGNFTAKIAVKNRGTAAGDGGLLDVWLNRASAAACDAAGNQRLAVGEVAPGASKTLTFANLRAGTAGAKTFRAFVDSACETAEGVDTNNQGIRPYTVR
jgi:hypothetical protein